MTDAANGVVALQLAEEPFRKAIRSAVVWECTKNGLAVAPVG